MTKRAPRKRREPPLQYARAPAILPANVSPVKLALGAVLLLVAVGTSVMLVLENIGGISLPGCGPGSGCAEAAVSVWGNVPYIDWPVSFLGLAYFLGALVVWAGGRSGVSTAFRYLVRFGALTSVGFMIVMFVEHHVCQYCVAVHLANLAFWIVMETTRTSSAAPGRSLAALCGVFLVVSAVLGVIEWRARQELNERGERELGEDITNIIAATERAAVAATQAAGGETPATAPGVAATHPAPPVADTTAPASAAAPAEQTASQDDYPFKDGFRGRYLHGPEKAAVRIVMLTDYQCRDCLRIENEVRTVLAQHDNVSLSIKHYPFCQACNPQVNRTLHPNACWAARAAEAAGIMWGDEGFFKMHFWLFDNKGLFTSTEQLEDAVRAIGYDPAGFVKVVTSDETLQRVQADIEEGALLGLFQTPMIFINGVEMRSWYATNAVVRAVEAVLAQQPEPQTHAHDHPPLALDKLIGDWREQRVRRMPPDQWPWALGAEDAKVRIDLYGDYQEPTTAEVNGIVRDWMRGRDDVRYTFRHYPFNKDCNQVLSVDTKHPQACWAARAAEAAGRLEGNDGYWRMHEWLLAHQDSLTDEALRAAAVELGFDPDALFAAMQQPDVLAAIQDDCAAAKRLGLQAIPQIHVNEKFILRWRFQGPEMGRKVLEGIFEEAAAGR